MTCIKFCIHNNQLLCNITCNTLYHCIFVHNLKIDPRFILARENFQDNLGFAFGRTVWNSREVFIRTSCFWIRPVMLVSSAYLMIGVLALFDWQSFVELKNKTGDRTMPWCLMCTSICYNDVHLLSVFTVTIEVSWSEIWKSMWRWCHTLLSHVI